jgi:D-arabinonate dehydratase
LYKLLGANQESVEAYVTGGYYYEDGENQNLREEIAGYVDDGHDAVKMKVGRLSTKRDAERIEVVRDVLGSERPLMLDANCTWDHKEAAVRACRTFEQYDPYFVEEPVMPDRLPLMRRINEELDTSIAAGEQEFTRYGFRDLLEVGEVDVIQPNATRAGGITEWLRIAKTASTMDIPVSPHHDWHIHVHLAAAVENAMWVEYLYRDADVWVFDDVLQHTIEPDDGRIQVPDRPGHGVIFDETALEQYRVS